MGLSAFHGDAAVRCGALTCLSLHMERKARIAGAFQWDDDKGTIAACLVDSGDPQTWTSKLGLAPWLAFALDAVTANLMTSRAVAVAGLLLQHISLGADTQPSASRSILLVLDELAGAEPLQKPLADVLGFVKEAHARLIAGEDIAPSQWRRLRRLAVEASQAAPHQDGAGSVIEAAAWNPYHSPTVVGEVLRHAISVASQRLRQRTDWTDDDDIRVQRLLTEMHETYILPDPAERRDVFQLLAVHHPADEARLRAHVEHRNLCGVDAAEHMLTLLLKGLDDAADPVA